MYRIKEIQMSGIYLDNFSCKEDIENDYKCTIDDGCEILFAAYEYANYEGSSFVLFKRGHVLYEVNGGHCSCNGLEGQWDPEETTRKDVLERLNYSSYLKRHREDILTALSKV
jgi:hypothetical protein